MVEVTTTVSQESLEKLNKTIDRIQSETGRNARESVAYAGGKVAESGRAAASKYGTAKRKIVVNPRYEQAKWARRRKKRGFDLTAQDESTLSDLNNLAPFFIVRLRQSGKPFLLPSYDKKDPRRVIETHKPGGRTGRGLAKDIWNIMAAKSYDSSKSKSSYHRRGKRWTVSKIESKEDVSVRLINKLSYLEKAYPGITQKAVDKGTKALIGSMRRKTAQTVAKANK